VKLRPRSTPTHLRSARPLFRSLWLAQDSALEQARFELLVPLDTSPGRGPLLLERFGSGSDGSCIGRADR
jgi:hypothetical protein